MIPFSVLDLSPILEGETPREALQHSVALARHVEALGYHRYWLAEHHNIAGIASAATAVVIGHVAGATSTIRVGSGGIMLPNHPPMVVAEQFGTLDALYPGRIDLGLGRAPGGDGMVLRALRRRPEDADRFPRDVQELQFFLDRPQEGQRIQAVPGAGSRVPIYLLGSSTYSAELAAMLGLPFAFAAHFAPDALGDALYLYRSNFKPSATHDKPYAMVGVGVVAADTDAEARRLFTSTQQAFVALRRGTPGKLKPPVDDLAAVGDPRERAGIDHALRYAIVGGADRVRLGVETLLEQTQADELIVTAQIYDQGARRRSYEILANVRDAMSGDRKAA
ncbi:putative enzyme [Beijerinckiaceae bacterium RH AL1]|nr:LLM class flavin-dependent oxidoreductase [Beijerinckiaceae bacterium]VVB48951.1 putative enzyme [Beijerinckiaceae bacterium RH CH11]VVB49029.1 putative enzyme [Beijerinckiaceae bacterium RH AL8]VVC56652.1 putative enzyme [Beijerinckiaceae bacterium RH AL1]